MFIVEGLIENTKNAYAYLIIKEGTFADTNKVKV